MRLTCPGCAERHEVSGRPAGTLVTCRCGETFAFPAAASTLASLQCNGCGAQTDPSLARCAYCDSVLSCVCCPNCFRLMAGDARHCSHCGIRVERPALAIHRHGERTLPCPRCTSALAVNLVGDHLFDRCDACGGIWAHHLALAGLFATQTQSYSVADWLERVREPGRRADVEAIALCPDCEQPMRRQALGGRRRMLVDSCEAHGIWFDHTELRRLVGPGPRGRSARPEARRRRRELDEWWPFEALEELLEFLEDLFD